MDKLALEVYKFKIRQLAHARAAVAIHIILFVPRKPIAWSKVFMRFYNHALMIVSVFLGAAMGVNVDYLAKIGLI